MRMGMGRAGKGQWRRTEGMGGDGRGGGVPSDVAMCGWGQWVMVNGAGASRRMWGCVGGGS